MSSSSDRATQERFNEQARRNIDLVAQATTNLNLRLYGVACVVVAVALEGVFHAFVVH